MRPSRSVVPGRESIHHRHTYTAKSGHPIGVHFGSTYGLITIKPFASNLSTEQNDKVRLIFKYVLTQRSCHRRLNPRMQLSYLPSSSRSAPTSYLLITSIHTYLPTSHTISLSSPYDLTLKLLLEHQLPTPKHSPYAKPLPQAASPVPIQIPPGHPQPPSPKRGSTHTSRRPRSRAAPPTAPAAWRPPPR